MKAEHAEFCCMLLVHKLTPVDAALLGACGTISCSMLGEATQADPTPVTDACAGSASAAGVLPLPTACIHREPSFSVNFDLQ